MRPAPKIILVGARATHPVAEVPIFAAKRPDGAGIRP
jgi:hypothetical protein